MSAGSLLALEALSVEIAGGRGRRRLLSDVDLELERGEILSLVGESGGGKTMLGLAIAGLLPPGACRDGRLSWCGREIPAGAGGDLLGREMGLVFQDPLACLDPVWTIGAQLEETLRRLQDLDGAAARTRSAALLAEMGFDDPERYLDRYPHQLSGGQRRRVMLALALAGDPALLIADEPTSGLDPALRRGVVRQLRDLAEARGMAILFITHDIGLAAGIAPRLAVLQGGRLVERGTTEELLASPRAAHTRELLAARPGLLERLAPASAPVSAAPLLRLRNLRVDYVTRGGLLGLRERRVSPLRDVDLDMATGDALALVGVSGCGKTTLARAAALLSPIARGTIDFAGHAASTTAPAARRRRVQMIFQDPGASLNPRQSCGEAVARALPAGPDRSARMQELLQTVGLPADVSRRYPHSLSGGQRQRVAIARALAADPDLLIADEPTSSLDVTTQAGILRLFAELRRARGLALLLITHDPAVAASACRETAVMLSGLIVERFPSSGKPCHPYSTALLAASSEIGADPAAAGQTLDGDDLVRSPKVSEGCPHAPICPLAEAACRRALPPLEPITKSHLLRCPPALRIHRTQ